MAYSEAYEAGRAEVDDLRLHGEWKTDIDIAEAIAAFNIDPADTEFQEGFLARLKEIFVEMQTRT